MGQVKHKFYYYFWGVCTVSVVLVQMSVASGYNNMARQFSKLNNEIKLAGHNFNELIFTIRNENPVGEVSLPICRGN